MLIMSGFVVSRKSPFEVTGRTHFTAYNKTISVYLISATRIISMYCIHCHLFKFFFWSICHFSLMIFTHHDRAYKVATTLKILTYNPIQSSIVKVFELVQIC